MNRVWILVVFSIIAGYILASACVGNPENMPNDKRFSPNGCLYFLKKHPIS
jgi:hypothetical protein